jgi:hypothetical protein
MCASVALSTGTVVELPWAFLEARSVYGAGAGAGAAASEEGYVAPAYAPELPLAPEAALTYNRSLARPARLHAAPAGLESTCLVLATGLGDYPRIHTYSRFIPEGVEHTSDIPPRCQRFTRITNIHTCHPHFIPEGVEDRSHFR